MKCDSRRVGASVSLTGALAILLVANSPLMVIASLGSKRPSPEGTQAQARQLWEQTIAAKGGRERLSSVTGMYMAVDQGQGDRAWNFFLFPDRYFHYSYGAKREDTVIKIFNGKLNLVWWQPNTSPAQLRHLKAGDEDDSLIREAQFVLLLETKWLKPTPLRVRNDWLGLKRVNVIETDTAGWRVDYFLDPKTHLPVRITYGYSLTERARGEMNHEVGLEDYVEIDGVMMPHRLTQSLTFNGAKRGWQEQATYELNPDYDEQIFEKAPTPKMVPQAWRPKKIGMICR